ncbi:MAG: aminotransferase class I/II-fold pyridoxal phosphate-dependent enzyme [Oscillibacter sp.]|nr:aminotransferase class I/II-fold pyridoxal phosphate-dependent enzyme [Oscillibacter sp.]
MKPYAHMSRAEQQQEYATVQATYQNLKARGLKLNMARGKPGKAQLDMVTDMFNILVKPEEFMCDGIETRNYGEVAGLPAAKALFADILGCKPEQCFVGGNASLQLMYDTIAKAYTNGLLHSETPWGKLDEVKWLCPAPGYDRHFKVTESMGMTLITVPMTSEGPDMDMVGKLIQDPAVKGMWNVPKYSNPEGVIYSEETIKRLASMKPAAPDFLLMWDNAYIIHEFDGDYVPFPDILSLCEQYGNADMVFEYASTSKVTFPGAGVAVMAASVANIEYMSKLINIQTIGFDKINQLRHVRYLKDKAHTLDLMKRHAAILGPKFKAVLDALDQEIAPLDIADWKHPKGGYFVSLDAMPGTAKRTLSLCREAGVVMTGAGATFPYGIDPNDSNIRIAPSLPPVEELNEAVAVFCTCLRLSALEKLMAD